MPAIKTVVRAIRVHVCDAVHGARVPNSVFGDKK